MLRLGYHRVAVGMAVLLWAGASAFSADPVRPGGPFALRFDVVPVKEVERVDVPGIDLEAVRTEDVERERQGLAPRYAIPNEVRITPDTHGTWERVRQGLWLWRLRISAPEAVSINLGFTRYFMPPGGQLLVYSADERHRLRPFTELDNEDHGELWLVQRRCRLPRRR
jgi:hypothetical protein